MLIMNLTDKRH